VRVCPLVAVLLVIVPLDATAQSPPTFSVAITESYELIEEVGTTRRIGRAGIEARNARTLDEALRLFPGIYVRTGGDGTPRIDVRGFRSRHVLLLINGVLVNSTADGQFDPARIPTEAIREIKVAYGTSSILYGDNALAAVIEITTVDGAAEARMHASLGTPGQGDGGGRFARTVGDWSFAATAAGYRTDGFRLPSSLTPTALEDGGRRENSDRERADLRGSVGYRFSPALSLATEWALGRGSFGVPAATVSDPTDIFAQPPRFERVEEYRTATGQVSLLAAPSGRVDLRAWVFRNRQREERARYDDASFSSIDDPLVAGTFQSRERTTVTGGSLLARVGLDAAGSLRLAVNQRREAFDASGVIRDLATGGTGGGGSGGGGGGGGRGGGASQPATFDLRAFATDRHVDVYSTGAEWQAYPMRRMGTVVGAAVNVQRRPGGAIEQAPTWLAGVSYAATPDLRLRASATRKIRVPSIDQLFNTASGNPGLRAEHAHSVEVGADYRALPTSTLGVAAFVTDARDFIERVSGSPFENQDHYRFRGVELTVQSRHVRTLDLRGTYTLLDADAVGVEETHPLQTRPRHRGSLEWTWTATAGSIVRGAASRTGSQWFDSRGANRVQLRADAFTVVDLGFTQRLAEHYDLAFDVTNVFDRLYDQAYGLPREGRAAVVTLRARLD
jgi:outer membrane cobalamin receptor